jgi:hypothetical protein
MMHTDDLIAMMAAGAAPVDRRLPARRMALALAGGAAGALAILLAVFGLRPDLGAVLALPLFWLKLAFPTALAAGALLVLGRLLRPGMRIGVGRWGALAAPVAMVWIAAAVLLLAAPSGGRMALLLGWSWRSCPFNIALLSLPLCATVAWAVRAMAPTRLRLAGAVAGLLAGSTATMVYCLHCPEMAAPFWALWYFLGMCLPAAAGALAGPRLLRW